MPRTRRPASLLLIACFLASLAIPTTARASVSEAGEANGVSSWYQSWSFSGLWSWLDSIWDADKGLIVP